MSWLSTLLWFVSAVLLSSAAKKNFILTGPKVYDIGSTEILAITVFGIEKKGDVNVRLLTSSDGRARSEQVLSEVTVSVENAQTKTAELSVPSSIPENDFNGKLRAVGSIGDYEINSTVEVTFRQPTTIVFVNTDKPIYKAGQTVKIRVLVTDSNLKPPSPAKDGEIWVTDPNRIRLAQWLNVSFAEGIVHREIPEDILKEPPLGTWTIHVKIDNRQYTTTFQVLEYVLPRFEVTVTPPPYVLLSSENATWKVCAKYTYGQPVRGRLHIKLSAPRRYWLKEESAIENNTEINGCKEMTLPVKELIGTRSYFYGSLELKAEVAEDGTGTKISGTGNIRPSADPYVIRRQEPYIQYFKPLIPLKVTMSVTTPDSKPLANEKVKACIRVTRKKWNKLRSITDNLNVCKNYTSNENGFVIFTIPPQDPYVVSINIEVEATEFNSTLGMQRPRDTLRLTPWFSPSGEHLQLQRLPRVNCSAFGPDVKVIQPFHYTFSEPGTRKVYYQVISRGELIKHGEFNITLKADNKNTSDDTYLPSYPEVLCGKESQWDSDFNSSKYSAEFLHTVQLTHEMVPKARILMYTVTSGLDVVADSTWYDIDPCFANKIEMKFGEQSQFPGSKATIRITAAAQSLCSISVVDKSVYILNKGDILSGDEVSRQLQLLDTSKDTPPHQTTPDYTYCQKKKDADNSDFGYRTSGYVDAITAFAFSGGIVMTDVELETRPCRHSETINRCINPQPVHSKRPVYATTSVAFSPVRDKVALTGGSAVSGFSPESSPAVTVRTNFPDTWLFQLEKVGDTGELVFKKDVPDSITEWQGTTICVHPEEGLGISKKASIVAVQPFFASLTLPYSVIRNETLPVIVTVFNYLKNCLPIKVHLDQTEDFVLYNGTLTRDICVCGEKSVTTRFHIKPWKLGQMNTTVTASTSNEQDVCGNFDIDNNVKRSDTLTKPVLVEAEGFLKEETTNDFFCLEDLEEGKFEADRLLQVPADAIKDSVRGYFSFTGDLMGPALEGIDKLVKLPTGCGEQNMIRLVPNIVVLDYLKATGRLTEKLKQKATNNIKQGYDRQQKYRHPDGSYSAFGTRDKEGSIWLTAFVVKTFSRARGYITVDEDLLSTSKDWVLSKQMDNGCFPMVGTVHHKAMKGGVAKEDGTTSALTAYILISMLESGSVSESTVEASLRCLEAMNAPSNYSLGLFAYAASLASHPSASSYLQQLIDKADRDGAYIYWQNDDKSIAIETAAYAILALLKDRDGDFQILGAVVKWLTAQRNPYGGFHSTQDTVVGLQALAEYGARISNQKLNMVLTVKSNQIDEAFEVTENEKLLTQRTDLRLEDKYETAVNIEASGNGCALAQILLRYNLPNPEPSEDFELSVQTEKQKDDKKIIMHICVRYNHENGSNMAIVEAKMVSGYVPVKNTVEELLQKSDLDIRRYEIKENKVYLYFNTLTEKKKCFSFDVVQEIEVLDAKSSNVKVYDYYDNDKVVSVPYNIEESM